ncbi:MAG: hypothetical protein HY589_05190 [Candidatus Omnitrophica bacterium]|nr:hypothetical protein [Candidatus Omnitrophota bacterium]
MNTIFSRFKKRERFLIIFTLTAGAALALYLCAIEPLFDSRSGFALRIQAANSRLVKNLKLLHDKEKIDDEFKKYKEYIESAGSEGDQMAVVLKEIEIAAMTSGVKIVSIKPKGEKQLKGYKKAVIEAVSEAKVEQFMKFIYEVEGSKKLLKVERCVLSLKSSQSDVLRGTLIIRKISF